MSFQILSRATCQQSWMGWNCKESSLLVRATSLLVNTVHYSSSQLSDSHVITLIVPFNSYFITFRTHLHYHYFSFASSVSARPTTHLGILFLPKNLTEVNMIHISRNNESIAI